MDYPFLARAEILTFEEIHRLAGIFARLGARKFRITGGEPLLRMDLDRLIAMLARLEVGKQAVDLALTTNGALLGEQAERLAAAGLDRITVSLDSLDDSVHQEVSDASVPVAQVLAGIAAAEAAGLAPIKINAVIRRGVNENAIEDLARRFRGTGHVVRFIEFMDVGTTNGWRLEEVVSAEEILSRLTQIQPLEPIGARYEGEVARRYRYLDGSGEVGIVASVTQPFCGACTRARLATDGQLFTCLFANQGLDLRAPLRDGASDAELVRLIAGRWAERDDRYSELRSVSTSDIERVEMSYIGG